MGHIWEYVKSGDGICICGLYGTGDCIKVPDEICGLPVTAMSPYAFSPSKPSARYDQKETEFWEEGTGITADSEPERLCGDRITGIEFPKGLKTIGDYCFYGCRKLKSIGFSGELEKIGSGAFMGCRAMEELDFEAAEGDEPLRALILMLSELSCELKVNISGDGAPYTVIFPEYYEISVENNPARIIAMHYQGTGYRYRQCFKGGKLDYKEYDGLFYLAREQEPAGVLAELAMARLKSERDLSRDAGKMYLDWFSLKVKEAGEYLLKKGDAEDISFLVNSGAFDGTAEKKGASTAASGRVVADGAGDFYMASMGENVVEAAGEYKYESGDDGEGKGESALEVLADMAGAGGYTEAFAILMDHRHRKYGGKKNRKSFEF